MVALPEVEGDLDGNDNLDNESTKDSESVEHALILEIGHHKIWNNCHENLSRNDILLG